ncbi:hypothetical protein E2C01_092119 [Portunus trituberculatus]|uniref:Uncharacterized protein n=1 Tax=Portunus trituberculatus TaxID=210409 RepID=A0A5B7JJB0_PORTR|nr:hypothetical protein [Portunus trituberculatus]
MPHNPTCVALNPSTPNSSPLNLRHRPPSAPQAPPPPLHRATKATCARLALDFYGTQASQAAILIRRRVAYNIGNINAAFVHRETHADQQAVATGGPCGRFKGRFSVPRQRTQLRLAALPPPPSTSCSSSSSSSTAYSSTFIFTEFSVTIFTN